MKEFPWDRRLRIMAEQQNIREREREARENAAHAQAVYQAIMRNVPLPTQPPAPPPPPQDVYPCLRSLADELAFRQARLAQIVRCWEC